MDVRESISVLSEEEMKTVVATLTRAIENVVTKAEIVETIAAIDVTVTEKEVVIFVTRMGRIA